MFVDNSEVVDIIKLLANCKLVDTYLIFVIFLHGQSFWRIKSTPKNANISRQICKKNTTFSRKICRKCQFFALNL